MHKTAVRSTIAVGMVFAAGIALAGCASASPSSSSAPTAAAGAVDLSGVCPATVIIQTDWNPEADHGHLYQLLGPNPVINADKKSVSGDLYSSGKSTGVKVEIRSGGPAIGFSTVSSEMYKDKDITLGYVSTDEAVQLSASLPTTAVFAENDISPQMIMWDPATYPKVKTIKELATALKSDGGVVRYFQGAAYMGYLQGSGILPEAQTDGAYDGTPAKFVTAKGKDGQQGFATAEPYIYQNEVSAWGKPVNFQLINDTGYPIYPEAMSVRSSELSTLSPCLKKLVPVLQQADVDYISKPAATNKLVTDLVTAFNNGWVYSEKIADFGVSQMKKLKIASNGSNAYVGDMDEARVQKVIDIDTPLFTASGSAPKTGLKAADLFTNEFLDTSIGF
ncbi:ABC transporter substrate-binding protein [Frigoribacterium sp. UYMn621]|uniref:ABC transporter substrate-binding protein n=1 Tax=Frigoribacterium sp. UYMn621 TaxID=3156343 RepID=UPI0033919AEE